MKNNILRFASALLIFCLVVLSFSYFNENESSFYDETLNHNVNIAVQKKESQFNLPKYNVFSMGETNAFVEKTVDNDIEAQQDDNAESIEEELAMSKEHLEEVLLKSSTINFEYLTELGKIYKDEGNLHWPIEFLIRF